MIKGGWLDGHWIQVLYQFADSCAGLAYSFCITYLILVVMDRIPGLSLRVDMDSEERGIDDSELGESAYYHVDRIANMIQFNHLNTTTTTTTPMIGMGGDKSPIQQNQYLQN